MFFLLKNKITARNLGGMWVPPLILVSCCVSLFKIPQSPFYIYINENTNMCVYVQRVVHTSHTVPPFALSFSHRNNKFPIYSDLRPPLYIFIICIQFNVCAAPPFKGWDPTVSGTLLSQILLLVWGSTATFVFRIEFTYP